MREPVGTQEAVVDSDDMARRAQGGSVSAVRALYLFHHQQIYRFIWARVGDPDLAEDLTGEVFVRMLQNLPAYEARSLPFHAWLYAIARNLIIDHHRMSISRQSISLNDIDEPPFEGASLEEHVEQSLKIEKVRQMLAKLQPDEREVVELRFLAGLSLKETALVTGKSIAAVKALQHRGLHILKTLCPH